VLGLTFYVTHDDRLLYLMTTLRSISDSAPFITLCLVLVIEAFSSVVQLSGLLPWVNFIFQGGKLIELQLQPT